MTKNIILKLCRCVHSLLLCTFTPAVLLDLQNLSCYTGNNVKTYTVNVGATTNSAIVCFIVGVAVALCRT